MDENPFGHCEEKHKLMLLQIGSNNANANGHPQQEEQHQERSAHLLNGGCQQHCQPESNGIYATDHHGQQQQFLPHHIQQSEEASNNQPGQFNCQMPLAANPLTAMEKHEANDGATGMDAQQMGFFPLAHPPPPPPPFLFLQNHQILQNHQNFLFGPKVSPTFETNGNSNNEADNNVGLKCPQLVVNGIDPNGQSTNGGAPICRGCGTEIHDRFLLSLNRRLPHRQCSSNGMENMGSRNPNELTAPKNDCNGNGNGKEEEEETMTIDAGNTADFWHEQCLQCAKCGCQLGEAAGSCFFHTGQPYCREDHEKFFAGSSANSHHSPHSRQCSRCTLPIGPNEFVFRSGPVHVFHLNCFQCSCCGQPLAKGDQYLCAEDGQLICQRDFGLWQLQQQLGTAPCAGGLKFPVPTNGGGPLGHSEQSAVARFLSMPPFPDLDFSLQRPNFHHHHHSDRSKKVPKRPRTILNGPQRKAFKLAFEKGPKPSRKVREQLARETGLSVRVVQVWFQNQRAKMKKERKRELDKQQQMMGKNGGLSVCGSNDLSEAGCIVDNHDQFGSQHALKSPQSAESADDSDMDEYDGEEEEDSATSCNSSSAGGLIPMGSQDGTMGIGGMEGGGGIGGNPQIGAEGMMIGQQQQQQQNPIEKLYNMHQTYFSFV